jgi:hypothetical protein
MMILQAGDSDPDSNFGLSDLVPMRALTEPEIQDQKGKYVLILLEELDPSFES